ncbi:MAG TPA: M67 family metallopeptidase [Gemmataceae bacterium]|nr:M67 family metallopeptidase [Gemmataceae bacterium]
MSTPFCLHLPRRLYAEMLAQAVAELPHECCGLLAGSLEGKEGGKRIGRVLRRYPLVNAAASPVEFVSEPHSMFAADRDMHRLGLDVLAVYHSHPASDPVPSRTDLQRNYSPDVMNLIISLKGAEPQVRGWWLDADHYHEGEWQRTEAD